MCLPLSVDLEFFLIYDYYECMYFVTTFLFTFVALGLFAGYADDIVDPTQLNNDIYIYGALLLEHCPPPAQ